MPIATDPAYIIRTNQFHYSRSPLAIFVEDKASITVTIEGLGTRTLNHSRQKTFCLPTPEDRKWWTEHRGRTVLVELLQVSDAIAPMRSDGLQESTSAEIGEDVETQLCRSVLNAIQADSDAFVAIGIDMAAKQRNWGISIITTNKTMSHGSLRLVLPSVVSQHVQTVMPSNRLLENLLNELTKLAIPTAVAVDIPFGWPREHASFLNSWSAVPSPETSVPPPERQCFEYRLCDREMMKELEGRGRRKAILAVGADKLASAAIEWAHLRHSLIVNREVDVGYDAPRANGIVFIETYPSVFVRLNFPSCDKYKKIGKTQGSDEVNSNVRRRLLGEIRKMYTIDLGDCAKAVEKACATSASDAFDGLLSALSAWDYLKWRKYGESEVRMSSPFMVLGPARAAEEKERIHDEGWFLVRFPEKLQ